METLTVFGAVNISNENIDSILTVNIWNENIDSILTVIG